MIRRELGCIKLKDDQYEACKKLHVGSILLGGVGSGKTYTSIFWAEQYYSQGMPIIVITTAMKRDLIESGKSKPDWQSSLEDCGIDDYIIDSWNNIKKYVDITNTCFIFDEQRVVGYGAWSKHFIQIARYNDNKWILLSATPGDVWMDYLPTFIANGFFSNKSQFIKNHVEYDRWAKYPKIKAYHKTAVLEKYRKSIIVNMKDNRDTERIRNRHRVAAPVDKLKELDKTRINYLTGEPILNAPEYISLVRRLIFSDEGRKQKAKSIISNHNKIIVFYNFNFELDILKDICTELGRSYTEWNGNRHDKIEEESDKWIFLVQYTAGAEGWNCITCDTILFYSLNYSYRKMEQAEGRIDRSNTPFKSLYYELLISDTKLDKDIMKAIQSKKRFNESAWVKKQVGDFKTKEETDDPFHGKYLSNGSEEKDKRNLSRSSSIKKRPYGYSRHS